MKYLVIEISGYGDVETEVRRQVIQSACLNNTIWSNKDI